MSNKRIKVSQKNSLIEDYRNGIHDKEFKVVPVKGKKGQYFIRRRKTPLTDEDLEEYDEPIECEEKEELEPPKNKKITNEPVTKKKKVNLTYNSPDSNVLALQNLLQQQVISRIDNLEFWKNKQKVKKQLKKERKRKNKDDDIEIVEEIIDTEPNEVRAYCETADFAKQKDESPLEKINNMTQQSNDELNEQESQYYEDSAEYVIPNRRSRIDYSRFGF